MAVTERTVSFSEDALRRVQQHLTEMGLDGWLLFDFRGANPVAGGVLGLPALSRRYFALLPAKGRPVAITHRIEQQPWRGWIGENRPYMSWQSLEEELARLLSGIGTIAVEHSPEDAVPYVDRMPAGVLELVHRAGVGTVSSGDLVSAFYSRWTPDGEASHRRAAEIVAATARAAFERIGDQIRAGETPNEWDLRGWVVDRLVEGGLRVGADSIVAVNRNGANPHYAPTGDQHSPIGVGDVVMIDLWGKEEDEAVYADQTWMAIVGAEPTERAQRVWEAVRDARVAAVRFIVDRVAEGRPVRGFEVDDVARGVIRARGFEDAFIHRTGHSIDRELHGSGPNIDNLETRDTRLLIPGVGFSIEPGIYLPGEIGVRSEVNVHLGSTGPVVTTPDPQTELIRIRV
jgi:Xaa-Pro dipeptidase